MDELRQTLLAPLPLCGDTLADANAFAPTNIALIKYWGKRDILRQLPTHSSLSVTLNDWGTTTRMRLHPAAHQLTLNQEVIAPHDPICQRLSSFLDLIKPDGDYFYQVESHSQVPIAAGLASSASGFAALVKALCALHQWPLTAVQMSQLARLGSGSACRSFWPGFVIWQHGQRSDGMDSHGVPLPAEWPGLCLGILAHRTTAKPISSREAMIQCQRTADSFQTWVQQSEQDLSRIQTAIGNRDFQQFGEIIETNAAAMHACMHDAKPSINYSDTTTALHLQQIKELRKQGIGIYATQDAGPNIKCIFLHKDKNVIETHLPSIQTMSLFTDT